MSEMKEQKQQVIPKIDDDEAGNIDYEHSGKSVNNHHYIPRQDFNNYNAGGGGTP